MNALDASPADLVTLFEQALSSAEEVCSQLADDQWDLPTDCPGWSVKDNLAHLASYEAVAIGRPPAGADVDVSHVTHIKQDNFFAVANERELQKRRPLPGRAILDEFREVTTERLKRLRDLDVAAWETDTSAFPFGEAKTADAMRLRVMDAFYHEQDIRRAVGRPGHLNGDVARYAFGTLSLGFARTVAKNAQAPEGSVVMWEVGPPGGTIAVRTEGGRGNLVEPPAAAAARISSDIETFFCLMGGRWTPQRALDDGRVRIEGDAALGRTVLGSCVVVP